MRLKKAEQGMIRSARVCRVGTANRAGIPSCVPVCPAFDGEKIYFGSANSGRKIANIRHNPNVALVFDDYTEAWSGLRGIMIVGEARLFEGGPVFRKVRRFLYKKYPQYGQEAALMEKEAVIVEVTPRRSFSWGL
ncbi:MAG: pyridoxamine 5'-phosphate oxidase family protein [Candidatus Binatia bacterium]